MILEMRIMKVMPLMSEEISTLGLMEHLISQSLLKTTLYITGSLGTYGSLGYRGQPCLHGQAKRNAKPVLVDHDE